MVIAHSEVSAGSETGEDFLARVEGLAPLILDSAAEGDRRCELPEALLDGLHEARLFRLLLPRAYGGAELSPPEFFGVIEAVAKLDGSTAWCLCQANGCAMAAAYLEPEVANEIWGDDPRGVVAWGPGPATARLDGEGFRITGRWSFASGAHHATWLGSACVLVDENDEPRHHESGKVIMRTALVPAAELPLERIWDTIGLRGTGSDAFEAEDLYVRCEYTISRDDAAERRYQAPLYQYRQMSLYASGFSATALGLSRAMFDAFKALAMEKTPRMARDVLRDNAVVQGEVARGEVRLKAARTFVLAELGEVWEDVVGRGELSIENRVRIRLATTHAIHEAKDVADKVYDLAGATAIFASSPFERRFRDLHTVTQQLQGRQTHFQTVGAYMLGHPADTAVL